MADWGENDKDYVRGLIKELADARMLVPLRTPASLAIDQAGSCLARLFSDLDEERFHHAATKEYAERLRVESERRLSYLGEVRGKYSEQKTTVEALTAKIAGLEGVVDRLRDDVREAYFEGFSDAKMFGSGEGAEEWHTSCARAALSPKDGMAE